MTLLNYRHTVPQAYISIHYSDSLPNTNAAKHKERGDKITVTELYLQLFGSISIHVGEVNFSVDIFSVFCIQLIILIIQ